MKYTLLVIAAVFALSACKKEDDNPTPQKTWADVKSIKIESAWLGPIDVDLISDSTRFTFVMPGSEFEVVSKNNGNGTVFPFTAFTIQKADPFSIYLEKSDCSPFEDITCPQDAITALPNEFGESLKTPWALVLEDSSQVNVSVTYVY